MVAANYNIILEQKADFSRSFKIEMDNEDLDIDGYSFNATLKERIQSDSGHDFTVSVADSATGTIIMTMTDEQTGAIKPGDYVYDLVMTDDTGLKTRLIQGIATVTGGITG